MIFHLFRIDVLFFLLRSRQVNFFSISSMYKLTLVVTVNLIDSIDSFAFAVFGSSSLAFWFVLLFLLSAATLHSVMPNSLSLIHFFPLSNRCWCSISIFRSKFQSFKPVSPHVWEKKLECFGQCQSQSQRERQIDNIFAIGQLGKRRTWAAVTATAVVAVDTTQISLKRIIDFCVFRHSFWGCQLIYGNSRRKKTEKCVWTFADCFVNGPLKRGRHNKTTQRTHSTIVNWIWIAHLNVEMHLRSLWYNFHESNHTYA